MRPDQDVDLALREPGQDGPHLRRAAQPRDHLDLDRELAQALPEGSQVLLRQDRGRHQHHHLLALGGRLVRGPQGDLGLPVADVAADQAVHRALGLHVALDRLDRLELVGRLAIRERLLEGELPFAVRREGMAAPGAALRVQVEQLAGQLARRPPGARLDPLPALRAQGRELRRLAARADVAGDLGQLVGGREDPVVTAVAELEVVAGDAGDGLGLEAREAGDSVVLVDDVVAHSQVGEGRQPPSRRSRRGGAAAMDQPPEGDHRQLQLRRDEPLGQATPRRTRGSPRRARIPRPGSGASSRFRL